MPFKEIRTVVHEGPLDSKEQFIVHITGNDYWCGVKLWSPGVPRFCLVAEKWPSAVKTAAKELCAGEKRRGREGDIEQVTAWLPRGNHPFVVGSKDPRVDVRYGGTLHSRQVVLEGVVIGFTFLE